MDRIVLAYAGGVEASVAIPWLRAQYKADVVTVTVDIGQGRELEAVRDRALALGAVRAHVLDWRDEFVRECVLPSLKADALYDGRSPMAASLGRPLVARALTEIADIEHTATVAHGGGRRGRKVPLDVLLKTLRPKLHVLAPLRAWDLSPEAVAAAATRYGMSPPAVAPCRAETNLWGRTIECPSLDDSWNEPPEDVFTLTRSARQCPDEPAYVEIAYERGVPVSINGVNMPLSELIGSLGPLAATHGVGRIDVVDHRVGGATLRELSEAPAALLLHAGHRDLRKLSAPRELERFARTISHEYADLIYSGQWFSPLRQALDGFVDATQDRITGVVRLKLFKGASSIVGRVLGPTAPVRRPVIIPVATI